MIAGNSNKYNIFFKAQRIRKSHPVGGKGQAPL